MSPMLQNFLITTIFYNIGRFHAIKNFKNSRNVVIFQEIFKLCNIELAGRHRQADTIKRMADTAKRYDGFFKLATKASLEERSKMTAVKIIFAVLICVPLAVVCYHFLKKLVDELGRK